MTTELVAELERRAARFAAVATVQQAISATISLDEAYRAIYKAVASVVDAPCFALMIAEPVSEKFTAQCIIVDSEEREGESVLDFPNGTETITKVFQTGVPISSSKPNSSARSATGATGSVIPLSGGRPNYMTCLATTRRGLTAAKVR